MNFVGLLFFLFAVFLSFVFGRYFFKYMGWWSTLPAVILGFGIVTGIIAALNKLLPKRPTWKVQQKLTERKNGD